MLILKKKLGIIAQYLGTRHDIRELISSLSQYYEVKIFLREPDIKLGEYFTKDNIEIRTIRANKKTIKNTFINIAYQLFGKLPKSKENYFITEKFKLNNSNLTPAIKLYQSILLTLCRVAPKWISYDAYLNALDYNDQTNIDDIDEFLCFTQIYDDYIFAHILDSKKPIKVYVYSWDHPCKMKTFSKRVHKYLVWNQGLKEDLFKLQGINYEYIKIWGSSQFIYLHDYKKSIDPKPYYDFDYIYFACATGYPKLVEQEVDIITKTADYIKQKHPKMKLVVRTYPFMGSDKYYAPLLSYDNVILDDYKEKFNSNSEPKSIIIDKLNKINKAQGLIHFGTTMGFEASYFSTPVILADMVPHHKELHQFVHQYQNDKYLNLEYPNISKDWHSYEKAIDAICSKNSEMLQYNYDVAASTELMSLETLIQNL